MNILLVEPYFPIAAKSKNHKEFFPIGLLKIASFYLNKGWAICLSMGNEEKSQIIFTSKSREIIENQLPNEIFITSYFTYWSKYVKDCVKYYRSMFPKIKITVGGIYATLLPNHCKKYTNCDEVYKGVMKEAEEFPPAIWYLEKKFGEMNFQIIHSTRGCIRNCKFCGINNIEPEFIAKESIKDEIVKKRVIFYDNNLLANPNIEKILDELIEMKKKNLIRICVAQSGIDGRLLIKNSDLAKKLKIAGFKEIKISWDDPYSEYSKIKRQINILEDAGYNRIRDISLFMIYNWEISYEEMEKKRQKCWEWKIQINDCRYRPLNATFDNYCPQKWKNGQTKNDYHIHTSSGWTDKKVRLFRKHIRAQNICIRYRLGFYSDAIERNRLDKDVSTILVEKARNLPIETLEPILQRMKIDYWFPENYNGNGHYMTKSQVLDIYHAETKMNGKIGNAFTKSFNKWWLKDHKKIIKSIK